MSYGRWAAPDSMRVQREGAQLQARGMWSAGQADDKARFLADLRALRDAAVVGYDELSARTHFPSDILKEAENGPALPTLPILAAYVRACDGDVPEWEERWRRLGSEAWADPSLPVRPAGASPAAAAGARAAVSIAPPDVYDPERIRAALRGGHGRSDTAIASRGAAAAAASTAGAGPQGSPAPDSPSSWSARPGWDDAVALPDTTGRGPVRDWGAHQGQDASQGWGAGTGQDPRQTQGWDVHQGQDASQGWDAHQGQDASQGWDGGTSQGGGGWFESSSRGSGADQHGGSRRGSGQNGDGAQSWDAGRNWDAAADAGANGNYHGGQEDVSFGLAATVTPDLSSAPESIWHDPFSASWLQDSELTAPPGPGTQRPPGADAQPQAQDGGTQPTPARTDAWAPADRNRTVPVPAQAQESVLEGVIAEPPPEAETAATAAAAAQALRKAAETPDKRRSGRYYPLRLVLIIVVAALIGSVLVLLLR
jgi:hypothetical protein